MTKDPKKVSAPSVRLLAKIEIKDTKISHKLLLPAPISGSVESLLKSIESKFSNSYTFDEVFIEPGLYKVENHFTIEQCFKDFDNILVKGSSKIEETPQKMSKNQKKRV